MKKRTGFILGLATYLFLVYFVYVLESEAPDANIKSLSNALWYAIVTLTTVGYGDFYPVTPTGKIAGLFLVLGSLGVIGYFIGGISNRIRNYMEKKKNGFFGTDFENHYMIIGWSEFGREVANQIFPTGHDVAFITNSKNDFDLIKNLYHNKQSFVMFADYHNTEAYGKANIEKTKAVFVNFQEDTDTLVFVLNLTKAFPDLNIIVNCNQSGLKETLKNAGIKHVISQSEVASRMVASYLFEPHVAEYAEDLISTSVHDEDQDIQQFKVVPENPYIGMKYIDVFIKMKKDINAILIGLVINNKIIKNPEDDLIIKEGDYLILISVGKERKQFEALFGVKEGV